MLRNMSRPQDVVNVSPLAASKEGAFASYGGLEPATEAAFRSLATKCCDNVSHLRAMIESTAS